MPLSLTCECGQHFEAPEADAGGGVPCPHCGRVLTVSKPKPPFDEEFLPWGPGPTVTSGKAIASLVLGVLFVFACLSGVPAILLGRRALNDIHRSGGRLRGRKMAIAGIVLGVIGCLFTVSLFLPAVRSAARRPGGRSASTTSSRSASLCTTTTTTYGSLPPAAITDKDGRPLLSWRVAILPFLDRSSLYAKFHLDEPWDSPHNLSLLDAMPNVYACPSDRDPETGDDRLPGRGRSRHGLQPGLHAVAVPDFTDGICTPSSSASAARASPGPSPMTSPSA